jgi:predicted nucleic acid-binding protein
MEILAGARNGRHLASLRSTILQYRMLRLLGLRGFQAAAQLQRTARAAGVSVANPIDFLIAVPTIREGATLLHDDADFDRLATCTPLRIEPVS